MFEYHHDTSGNVFLTVRQLRCSITKCIFFISPHKTDVGDNLAQAKAQRVGWGNKTRITWWKVSRSTHLSLSAWSEWLQLNQYRPAQWALSWDEAAADTRTRRSWKWQRDAQGRIWRSMPSLSTAGSDEALIQPRSAPKDNQAPQTALYGFSLFQCTGPLVTIYIYIWK